MHERHTEVRSQPKAFFFFFLKKKNEPTSPLPGRRGTNTKSEKVRGGTRQKNQTEPPQHYPKRAPAIWRQIQNAHERNHAELLMQLGLDFIENG